MPVNSCSPPLQAGPSSRWAYFSAIASHALSTAVAIYVAAKVCGWLPTTLALIRLPDGTVSHDAWAWAPLLLNLTALVAIASPVSFRAILDLGRAIRAPGQQARDRDWRE